jgi:hypothetical protein
MTRDDILKMAREAAHPYENAIFASLWGEYWSIKFASFVAAAEREECAKTCEALQDWPPDATPYDCAAAIRARGEK